MVLITWFSTGCSRYRHRNTRGLRWHAPKASSTRKHRSTLYHRCHPPANPPTADQFQCRECFQMHRCDLSEVAWARFLLSLLFSKFKDSRTHLLVIGAMHTLAWMLDRTPIATPPQFPGAHRAPELTSLGPGVDPGFTRGSPGVDPGFTRGPGVAGITDVL